ncbi:MAG TPA: hypothetical protein VK324_10915 [Tepidisphaeraceae bacterium]|nr:hypothetical protein [Tepidisphaeraceae bacterium]
MKMTPRQRKVAGIGGTVVAVLGVGTYLWASRPPKPTDDPKKVVAYVASDAFAEQKQQYAQEARDAGGRERWEAFGQLSAEDRAKAMVNMMGATTRPSPMAEYYKLPPGPQRVAYLDKMIDEQERRRAEWARRASTHPANGEERGRRGDGPQGGGWRDPAFRKAMDDLIPPTQRAEWADFRAAVRERRQQRGLPDRGNWGGR